jgi:hypothetical protein
VIPWALERWLILHDIDPAYWWLTKTFKPFMIFSVVLDESCSN